MATTINTPRPAVVDVAGFCQMFGISRSKFYALAREGRIQVLKQGTKSFVAMDECDRYLASLQDG